MSTATLLRADGTVAKLYDFLYGLEYVDLSYGLMLGSVELEQLSDGEAGLQQGYESLKCEPARLEMISAGVTFW